MFNILGGIQGTKPTFDNLTGINYFNKLIKNYLKT